MKVEVDDPLKNTATICRKDPAYSLQFPFQNIQQLLKNYLAFGEVIIKLEDREPIVKRTFKAFVYKHRNLQFILTAKM